MYAAAFSGFYVAMILVLCSLSSARWPLIIAEKSPMHAGVNVGCRAGHRQSGAAGSLRYCLGNLLLGVPFAFTPQLRVEYSAASGNC